MKRLCIYLLLTSMLLAACNKSPVIDDVTMLDGNQIFDASLNHPENYLASSYLANPTENQLNTPVIIASHGYSASTFEWDELRVFADKNKGFYVSQVLLGGHGRTYQEFKDATWKDWQQSIKDEYEKLSKMGFKKIYLAGSSTSGALLLNLIKSNFFSSYTKPKGIFLIDPIVLPSNKSLTMIGLLGPVLGFTTSELEEGEKGYWYVYRPQESLKQLLAVIDLTRRDLEDGFSLPQDTYLKVYKSIKDETAEPVSALLIYKGLKTSKGANIDVEMVESNLHVFTRLKGRSNVSSTDEALQLKTFTEMRNKMLE
ncbi:alpha/beta hydrolase [Arcicella rigui]|uniref:Esterase n=1 Tax=Arcicella rigui TaxID=797020 RepID=A0ABU5QGW1_9BACT|nr:esterase [Arcicella rigui]MEA5141872.1 esterase [Arcicella rigui]